MNTDFQSEFLNFRYIQAVTSSGEECGDWRISDEKLSRRCSSTVGRPTPSMYAGSKAVRKRARDEDTASNTSASGSVSSTDSSSVCPGTSYAMPANSRSRRSSSLPAPMLAERPKRQIVPKSPENSVTGLSWREETQLKKALYASLNESKLQRSLSKEIKESESGDLSESSQSAADKRSLQINGSKISEGSFCQDKNSLKPNSSNRSKVRAQRKFAEGSRPNSPCVTPVKLKDPLGSPTMLSTMSHGDIPPTKRLQKTEDFLTFLCIRKNPFLPPQFEVFKQPTVIEHIPPYRSSSSRLHLLNRGSHKRDDLGVRPLEKQDLEKPLRISLRHTWPSQPCCFKPENEWWLQRDTKRVYWSKDAISFDDLVFPFDFRAEKDESHNSETIDETTDKISGTMHASEENIALPAPDVLKITSMANAACVEFGTDQKPMFSDFASTLLTENWDIDIDQYAFEDDKEKIESELLGPDKDCLSPLALPSTPRKDAKNVGVLNPLLDHSYGHETLLDRVSAIIRRNNDHQNESDSAENETEAPTCQSALMENMLNPEQQAVSTPHCDEHSPNYITNTNLSSSNGVQSCCREKSDQPASIHPLTRLFGFHDQCIKLPIIHVSRDIILAVKGTLKEDDLDQSAVGEDVANNDSFNVNKLTGKSIDSGCHKETSLDIASKTDTASLELNNPATVTGSWVTDLNTSTDEINNSLKFEEPSQDPESEKMRSDDVALVTGLIRKSQSPEIECFDTRSFMNKTYSNNNKCNKSFKRVRFLDGLTVGSDCEQTKIQRNKKTVDTVSTMSSTDVISPRLAGTSSHFESKNQWYDDEKPLKASDLSTMILWPLPPAIPAPGIWKSYGRSRRAEPKKRNKIIANQDSDNPIKRPRGRPVGSKSGPKVQTGVVAATKLAKAARQTMMRKSQAKASQKASSKSVKKPVKISQRQQQMRKRLRQRLVRKLRPRRSRVPIEALMMSDQDDDDYFEDFEHLIDVIPAAVVRTDGDVVEADISSGEELDDVDDDDDDDDDDDVDEASKPRSLRSTTVAVRNSFSSPRKINHDNNRCRSSSRLISSYRDTDSESLHSISDSVTSSTRSTRSMCTAGMTPSPLKTKSFYAEKRKLSPVVPLKVNIPSGRRNDGSKSARAGWTSCGSASNGGSPSTSRDSTPISRSVQSQRKRALDDIDGLPNIISNLDQILADVPKRVQNSDRVSSKTANRPLKRSRGRPSKSDADDWTSPAKKKAKRSRGSVKESHSGQSSYSGVGCATGGSGSRVIQCPVYKPTELEFKDPILYISSIKEEASHYGICRIIPPESWKPDCKVHDEMRFISQMQYIHMLREKWGPSLQKLECIKKHLHSQGLDLETLPVIGGVELDLPRLSSVIQGLGGLRNVPDKKRWGKVADLLGISKLALDRTTKLYDAYCRYLLSYDTLSDADKQKLEDSVLEDWKSGEMPTPDNIVRGRSNSLSGFYRAARNTFAMWFKDVETSTDQIENEYWNVIDDRQHHVAIQYGHVDTKTSGSGFPSRKENPYCKHPWNLNVLAMNNGSLLRNLGSVSGVTVPTLHIGMLFSTKCWSRDNHMLPYINYLHTGADTIWYSIVKGQVGKFKQLMADLFPDRLHDHPITSKNGAVMVSPDVLIEGGVNVCRTVQRQREFVVVFPETYCASVCCGYNISESVHYATTDYLPLGTCAAKVKGSVELADASEAEKFSMDKLLYVLAKSEKTSNIILQSVLPHLESAIEDELSLRQQLREAGLKNSDQMVMLDENVYAYAKKRKNLEFMEEEDNVCKISRKICFFSMVVNVVEDKVYSLPHALQHILKKKNLRACKLMYRHSEEDLLNLITSVKDRLKVPQTKRKTAKKSSNTPR